MAIIGVHGLLYTSEPEALRTVLREAFAWENVDAHEGWPIFRLPPAELGVHPAEHPAHEISLMCDDLDRTMVDLAARGVRFEGSPQDRGFGVVVTLVLPGDVRMLLYEPRHASPI